jgi:hypothetical protein
MEENHMKKIARRTIRKVTEFPVDRKGTRTITMTKNFRHYIPFAFARKALASLLLAVLAPAVGAETVYNVGTLRYENEGDYLAVATLRYRDCRMTRGVSIAGGGTVDYNLGGKNANWTSDGYGHCAQGPRLGDEVWLQIEIIGGDVQSCRKDSARFYYKKAGGGMVKYVTRGTSLLRNRCRIDSTPSNDHIVK